MIGMTPADVDACSLWQFMAAQDGYRRAHMTEAEAAHDLSPDEVEELSAMVDG